MAKRIRIAILPDGRVQAEVQGVKGKACTNYVGVLEELLNAEVIDSQYTPEYYADGETENRLEISEQTRSENR